MSSRTTPLSRIHIPWFSPKVDINFSKCNSIFIFDYFQYACEWFCCCCSLDLIWSSDWQDFSTSTRCDDLDWNSALCCQWSHWQKVSWGNFFQIRSYRQKYNTKMKSKIEGHVKSTRFIGLKGYHVISPTGHFDYCHFAYNGLPTMTFCLRRFAYYDVSPTTTSTTTTTTLYLTLITKPITKPCGAT